MNTINMITIKNRNFCQISLYEWFN